MTDLERLILDWRQEATAMRVGGSWGQGTYWADALDGCADELEQLIVCEESE